MPYVILHFFPLWHKGFFTSSPIIVRVKIYHNDSILKSIKKKYVGKLS